MAKGNIAKENVINKIKEAFGTNFVGVFEKKIYVWADDGGEKVQIALAMTCPKVPIGQINTSELSYNTGRDFSDDNVVAVAPEHVEISDEERADVRELMKKLGL